MTVSLSALLAGFGLTACGSGSTANPPTAGGTSPVSAAPDAGRSSASAAAPSAAPSASPSTTPPVGGSTATADSGGSHIAKCRTGELRWTLTRFTGEGTGAKDPANAELVAVSSGSQSCTLAGYPKLEFHQGKGPQADGVGTGSPAPVTLGAGRKAVFALRYSEMNGKGPDSGNCNPLVTAGAAEVAAPGDSAVVRVPVVDG
ncbi:DUF4232 domain-containing protein, partial [Kitasatospora sp. NPDC056531]|uniref:DUF4232 domain-containing protein n=1 Tax=Kitasatospora sp. NPDC056531 TaxID=3345856 RepID=UPI0036B81DB3